MEKTERHTYGDHFMTTETGIKVLQLQAKNTWIHQKLEAARRVPPLDPSEGVEPCRHLDLTLQPPDVRENKLLFSATWFVGVCLAALVN